MMLCYFLGLDELWSRFHLAQDRHKINLRCKCRLFLDLAELYCGGAEKVRKRWLEYLAYEAQLIQDMGISGDRMH